MTTSQVRTDDIWLRRELVAGGLTDRDIRHQVRAGLLTRLRHGAYVSAELTADLDAVGLMRARSRAALRTAHPSAVLSHQCALAEFEVPLWGVDLDQVHLDRVDGCGGRRDAGVVHHRASLDERWWLVRGDVPVVHPALAAIEVATAYGAEAGLVAACGVLHRGLATSAELHDAAELARHWPGSLSTRLVLARADARMTNPAEARTWHFFFAQRIPRPEPQVEVHDRRGHLLGVVDFLWPELGVFLEFDGRIKYEQHRQPGESLADYLMREKRRAEQICTTKGWVCIRITWSDLECPVLLARRIREALAARARPHGLASDF